METQKNVTFIDFLVVLIKYRKLIVIPTILIVLALLLVMLITQKPLPNPFASKGDISAIVLPIYIPGYVASGTGGTIASQIQKKVSDIGFISAIVDRFLTEYPEFNPWKGIDATFLLSMREKLQFFRGAENSYSNHHITFRFANRFNGDEEFFAILFEHLESTIMAEYFEWYENYLVQTEKLLASLKVVFEDVAPEQNSGILSQEIQNRERITFFFTNLQSLWEGPPVILAREPLFTDRYVIQILAAITVISLFILSILSFCLHGIKNLKLDRVKIDKLKKAFKE